MINTAPAPSYPAAFRPTFTFRTTVLAMVFCASLAYFGVRGPYRAIGSLNSYDFSVVYGAARCWLQGQNPYDMADVRHAIVLAGDRPPLPHADPVPSIYLPTALPVVAVTAQLSWLAARLLWCLLSLAAFAFSLLLILKNSALPARSKWLLASALLLFSPTTSGLSTGNPSVLSCALTVLAVYLAMAERPIWSAIALGVALCFKPQIAICAVALLALWRYWKPLGLSFALPLLSASVSMLRASSFAQYRQWLASLLHGMAGTFVAGALSDPRPSNVFSYQMLNADTVFGVFVPDLKLDNLIVWVIAGAMIAAYLLLRRSVAGDRRRRDMAFFSALTLTLVYHRYYDAQLLLLAVPFILGSSSWERKQHSSRSWSAAGVLCCLLVLEFPLQAMSARWASAMPVDRSLAGFLLFRHEPLALLAMCLFLLPFRQRNTAESERGY